MLLPAQNFVKYRILNRFVRGLCPRNILHQLYQLNCRVKKVNCTLVQALRLCTGRTAQRGSRGIALLFLDHGTRRGEGSATRPGRSLPPGKTLYPLYRRLGGPQGRSGRFGKSRPHRDSIPDRPFRS